MNKYIFNFFFIISIIGFLLTPQNALAETTACYVFKKVYNTGLETFRRTADESGVRYSMDSECKRLPGSIIVFCEDLVAEYFDVMMQLIPADVPTIEAAYATRLCEDNTCPAGQTFKTDRCVTCDQAYYKESSGTGPCVACPKNGTTSISNNASEHDSITDCYITSGYDDSGTYVFDNEKCNYSK